MNNIMVKLKCSHLGRCSGSADSGTSGSDGGTIGGGGICICRGGPGA